LVALLTPEFSPWWREMFSVLRTIGRAARVWVCLPRTLPRVCETPPAGVPPKSDFCPRRRPLPGDGEALFRVPQEFGSPRGVQCRRAPGPWLWARKRPLLGRKRPLLRFPSRPPPGPGLGRLLRLSLAGRLPDPCWVVPLCAPPPAGFRASGSGPPSSTPIDDRTWERAVS